jgi:hypothetical protein
VVEVASQSAAVKACVVLTGAPVVALTGFVAATQVDAASAHADTIKTVATMGVIRSGRHFTSGLNRPICKPNWTSS